LVTPAHAVKTARYFRCFFIDFRQESGCWFAIVAVKALDEKSRP
jgi:hypothetical protein